MHHITVEERRSRLGSRQFLAEPGAGVGEVATGLVGLHSSDPPTVFLSLRQRIPGFESALLEAALYEERSLLRLLGMRRTMFVVDRELGSTMNAACTQALVGPEQRRLAKLVEDAGHADHGAAWVDSVCSKTMAALEKRGEAVATELSEDVPELALKLSFGEGKKWAGQVGISTRILFLLATEGRIVRARPRGTWLSSQYRWAPTADWIGTSLPDLDDAEAQRDLLSRWLNTFGPGTMTDIKWWTGWTVRATKSALTACEAVEVSIDNTDGESTAWVSPADDGATAPAPQWAALLPALDPTPMGYKQRNWFLGDHQVALYDRNGNIGPTVWSNGRVVGGWGQSPDGAVKVRILEDLTADDHDLIEVERTRLEEWLDGTTVMPRFPTPLQKELAST